MNYIERGVRLLLAGIFFITGIPFGFICAFIWWAAILCQVAVLKHYFKTGVLDWSIDSIAEFVFLQEAATNCILYIPSKILSERRIND